MRDCTVDKFLTMLPKFKKVFTVSEVSKNLGVSGTTVKKFIESGACPAIAIPYGNKKTYHIMRTDLEYFLKKQFEKTF